MPLAVSDFRSTLKQSNEPPTIESNITSTNLIDESSGPDRNPFIQWISGIFGVTTTEKPVALSPPETCQKCSKPILLLNKKTVVLITLTTKTIYLMSLPAYLPA